MNAVTPAPPTLPSTPPPATGHRPLCCTCWVGLAVALLLILAGFSGLDRWFYEHVSLLLNHEDRPLDRDFYKLTKPFWLLCRYAFGYGAVGLIVALSTIVWTPQRWRTVTALVVAVAVAALLANVAQGAIGRLRPNQASSHLAFTRPFEELLTKDRVCFPSGEAAAAFAWAWALTRLHPRWRWVFYGAASLAGGARLINGAHYPSDVVAGALLGVLLAAAVWHCLRRLVPSLA